MSDREPPAAMDDVPADILPPPRIREALNPLYVLAECYDATGMPIGAEDIRHCADDAARNVAQLLAAQAAGLDEAGVKRLRELAESWDGRPVADCGPWTCARELLAVLDGAS